MIISNNTIKKTVHDLINDHGIIKKIQLSDSTLIGFLVRYEIENTNEYASVGINISFNNKYLCSELNKNKFFYPSEYKYFAIDRIFKIKKNLDDCIKFELNHEIETNKFKEWLKSYINHSFNCNSEFEKERIFSFIHFSIKNIKNYYKNKKINLFFI